MMHDALSFKREQFMTSMPLAGRRVIELGTMIAAPFATHILSQLGAEVIKVEPPTGDTTRSLVRGGPSGTFIAYNHDKKSIGLDLATPEGREVFHRLLTTADVLVHNLAPSSARKLKVTAEDVAAVNPRLVYCHIRGYGAGPQQEDLASNPVAEAATGVMEGHRIDGRPSRLGPSYHDQFAGAYAVIRILATLMQPSPPAEARRIEIGLYETGLHVASRDLAGVQLKTQLLGRPERELHGEFSMPGYGAYRTSDDRWIYLLILTDAHWRKLASGLAMPEADEPALAHLRQRKKERDRVEAAVRKAIGALTFDEAARRLGEAAVGFTEVLPLERVLEAPQARHAGKLRDVAFRGLAFETPVFPGAIESAIGLPPPELGEHTLELLDELDFDERQRAALVDHRAVTVAGADDFAWAPVRPT
jgi:crotonobetainyl-CoA:carnitine CoA-transferase CaiB-like acyl-CoA transferase